MTLAVSLSTGLAIYVYSNTIAQQRNTVSSEDSAPMNGARSRSTTFVTFILAQGLNSEAPHDSNLTYKCKERKDAHILHFATVAPDLFARHPPHPQAIPSRDGRERCQMKTPGSAGTSSESESRLPNHPGPSAPGPPAALSIPTDPSSRVASGPRSTTRATSRGRPPRDRGSVRRSGPAGAPRPRARAAPRTQTARCISEGGCRVARLAVGNVTGCSQRVEEEVR